MTVTPQERAFPVFRRGDMQRQYLSLLRFGLRRQIDPATEEPYTEPEILAATVEGTRHWADGNALELTEFANQQRALFLVDQWRPERASSATLENTHGPARDMPRLDAQGGTGIVRIEAPVGTMFAGSTTKPAAGVVQLTDPAKLRYQVLYTESAGAEGFADLVVSGIDTGNATNLIAETKLVFVNPPAGVTAAPLVLENFSGGTPAESDRDWSARMVAEDLYKQGSGNPPQLRAMVRRASSSIDDAFVYSCALGSGSTVIAVGQKRGTVKGPSARIANVSTLLAAQSVVSTPGTVELPGDPYVIVTPFQEQATDIRVYASLARARATGWQDAEPWPSPSLGAGAEISTVTSQTSVRVTTTGPAPALAAPALMAWDEATSAWVKLAVQSVAVFSAGVYTVTLTQAPNFTLAVGAYVCPDTKRRDPAARGIESYLDSLGPGEVVNLQTDPRAYRAVRFPLSSDERGSEAGAGVSSYLQEALGAALAGAVYEIDDGVPELPSDPNAGPFVIVAGRVGLYPKPA
jgi:uncharacterized phage protein gp47/JayE